MRKRTLLNSLDWKYNAGEQTYKIPTEFIDKYIKEVIIKVIILVRCKFMCNEKRTQRPLYSTFPH